MKEIAYSEELEIFLKKEFVPAGYIITSDIIIDSVPENSKYSALSFSLNKKKITYRQGKVTPDRPGAFLTLWQRPSSSSEINNKPIPLNFEQLDYLFIKVQGPSQRVGLFIFPVSLLIAKNIISKKDSKGKTGFRVFPPWSEDRGNKGMKVFSDSGKKTQRWQLPYFIEITESGSIDHSALNKLFK
ncbi:hypothetical protein A9Q84_18940 [Halobacteriovorax marinus]|uniref:MepB protein n=1 Tax=Halobacteriovorax marinus TaxID=97084 RepID=A0A1Y5F278_9BACT|nr:hypothetical protein A9Q84_18940 [Halobacteriovorax marinus]